MVGDDDRHRDGVDDLRRSARELRLPPRVRHQWPPPGIPLPEWKTFLVFSCLLWGSSIPVWWGERGIKRGKQMRLRLSLALAWLMAAAFVGYSFKDYADLSFGWRDNVYGSIYYVTTGLHLAT